MAITVEGTEQLTTLSARFRAEADIGLAQELQSHVSDAVSGLPQAARDNAIRTLPGSRRPNGLGAWLVQRTQFNQTEETGAGEVTVTVSATSSHDIGLIDRGTVWHPLFGNRRYWYSQSVTAGWWSNPVRDVSPRVQPEIELAMNTVSRRLGG